MTAPFMRAYAELLVQTCHRRGAFAIGGMSAFIPSRRDPEVNERAFAQVRADKEREAGDGFDGSWVAHPDLVPVCRGGLRRGARRPAEPARPAPRRRPRHRRGSARRRLRRRARSPRPGCTATSRWRSATWRPGCGGIGAVAIHNLMEDAATAEISRSQIWQWVHNGSHARRRHDRHRRAGPRRHGRGDGRHPRRARRRAYDGRIRETASGSEQVALADDYVDFLTLPAYEAASASSTATSAGVSRASPTTSTSSSPTADADAGRSCYPGDRGVRQPVHTVYVPADRFTADHRQRLGTAGARGARRGRRHADELADAIGAMPVEVTSVGLRPGAPRSSRPSRSRTCGSTSRTATATAPDDEEDAAAVAAARALAAGRRRRERRAVPRDPLQVFEEPTRRRGLRTLDLFLGELVRDGRAHRRVRC